MTELKCPVCQNNLHKINIVVSTCTNDKCKLWGSSIPNLVLEALTDTKKKLDIAVDALKEISLRYSNDRNAQETVWTITAIDMAECADNALEQIKDNNKDIK